MNCKECGKTRTAQEQVIFNGICFDCAPRDNAHAAYVTACELAQDIEDRGELLDMLEFLADRTGGTAQERTDRLEKKIAKLDGEFDGMLQRIRDLEKITERQLERTIRMLNTLEAKA